MQGGGGCFKAVAGVCKQSRPPPPPEKKEGGGYLVQGGGGLLYQTRASMSLLFRIGGNVALFEQE